MSAPGTVGALFVEELEEAGELGCVALLAQAEPIVSDARTATPVAISLFMVKLLGVRAARAAATCVRESTLFFA
jgi:hypothetical protein